ncbi:MAG: hypothetical protein ACRD8U_19730, partial [Pyrinomonadaceae bacterium]
MSQRGPAGRDTLDGPSKFSLASRSVRQSIQCCLHFFDNAIGGWIPKAIALEDFSAIDAHGEFAQASANDLQLHVGLLLEMRRHPGGDESFPWSNRTAVNRNVLQV